MLRTTQRIVLCTSLFILFVLAPNPLWACTIICSPLNEIKLDLPNEKLKSYDAVFLGTLVEKAERVEDRPCRKKEAGPVLGPPNPSAGPTDQKKAMLTTKNSSECEEDLNSPNDENRQHFTIYTAMNEHIYTFRVNKAWKGVNGKTVSLFKYMDMTTCSHMKCGTPNWVLEDHPWEFELGRRYLVYAYQSIEALLSEENNRLHPAWSATKLAERAEVEMMFLNAAKKNASVASVVKQLPNVFLSRSSSVTKAEAIKWLRHAPPATSTEDRRKFFVKALVRTDENLRKMKTPPTKAKDFEGLPGYQEYLDEDDTTILTAIALALGNEEFKGNRDVIHVLRYLLNGVEPLVNIAAAESLKRLGVKDQETDKRIYEVLRYGLGHSNMSIRNSTLKALARIKSPEARKISITDIKRHLTTDSEESVDILLEYMNKAKGSESPGDP